MYKLYLFGDGGTEIPTGFGVRTRAQVEAWMERGIQDFGLDWRAGDLIRFRVPTGHFGGCIFWWRRTSKK